MKLFCLLLKIIRESGVRKLKEILFDIISDINLDLFKHSKTIHIHITEDDITNNYLKDKRKMTHVKAPEHPDVGVICGLWANELGMGYHYHSSVYIFLGNI